MTKDEAAVVLGMLARGDRQSDIAQYFGVNQGQVSKVKSGMRFSGTLPALDLPEPGPYRVVGVQRFTELQIAAAVPASMLRKLVEDVAHIKEVLSGTAVRVP